MNYKLSTVRHATRSKVGRAQQSTVSDDFRRLVYIPICAAVYEELARRFLQQEHNGIYQGISALSTASEMFLDLAKIVDFTKRFGLIRTQVDVEVLRTEVSVVSNLFRREDGYLPSNLNRLQQFVRPFMRCIPVSHNCQTLHVHCLVLRLQMNVHSHRWVE